MSISINQISSFCQTHVVPKMIDNIFNSNVLLKILMEKKSKKWPGGTYYEVPVQFTYNTNGGAYGDAATLTTATVEEFTKAQFAAKRYNIGIALEGLDLEMNKGSAKVLSLVSEKMKSAEKKLKDIFGDHVYGTTPSNGITGLQDICALDEGAGDAYGGITGGPNGDAHEWLSSSGSLGRANGPDATTTTLTLSVLDTHYNSVKLDNDHPDILVTTDSIWSGIMTTFIAPNMRYTDAKMADLGFENFKYRKAYAYGDDKCPAGNLFLLNSEHLYFAIFPGMNFKFIPWDKAVNSDVHIAHIRWYGQLICDERRKQGWMSAITTVSSS